MATLAQRARRRLPTLRPGRKNWNPGTLLRFAETWNGNPTENLPHNYQTYVAEGYAGNGVIFAIQLARLTLFSEITFAASDDPMNPRAGTLTSPPDLRILRYPDGPGQPSGRRFLQRYEVNKGLAGNAYAWRTSNTAGQEVIRNLRPDWVSIIANAETHERFGYIYHPGSTTIGNARTQTFIPLRDMAHWMGEPDPTHPYRGMSWLTPIAREVDADTNMAKHRNRFFGQQNATPNLLIKYAQEIKQPVKDALREELALHYGGIDNAYKTMLIDAGGDPMVVGSDMKQLDFRLVQGAGETRMCNAGGVPPVIVGVAEGLQAATYSNYQHAMRRYADISMRPWWGTAAEALDTIVDTGSSVLWYDDTNIPALQQDARDEADIVYRKSQTMAVLARVGYELDDIAAAVESGDLSGLQHSGNIPVTLYPEGIDTPAEAGQAASND